MKVRKAWKAILVQDLVDAEQAELKTGPFGTQLHASDYVEHGTPVINVRNIGFGEIRDGDLEFINAETVNRLSGHLLQANDIVFGRKGAVERHVFIRKKYAGWFQGSDCLRLRVSSPDVEPQFLSYCFQTEFHKRWMMNHCSHGATMTSLNQEIICRIPLHLPPIKIQRKFINILSAYDDLIENNTRRIQILERMAQSVYREWFVNFRFLGHAKIKLVASLLGKIPQGWQAVPVPEAVFVNPKTTVPKAGEKPFVPMTSLSNDSVLITDIESRAGNSGSKFKNGDTLFARITPCLENGKTAFVQCLPSDEDVAFGSTEFIVMRPNTVTPEFVYLMARSSEFRDNAIKSMSGATGRQRVQEACFAKFLIAQPGEPELAAFTKIIRPMFKLIHGLAAKNANLRRTRDLLLPKLISGALDVSKLGIEAGSATP